MIKLFFGKLVSIRTEKKQFPKKNLRDHSTKKNVEQCAHNLDDIYQKAVIFCNISKSNR